ncbi:unnamed protein product [Brachionus calyciflorus]|uniref:Glycoprotein-N-acetylgalactosamine 3-beta-galactosyltransferase 1 n=1 Tax=Brachionus calyciflorus TaxID=104777 RepID=A0A814NA90_9BILA|nr:unnamed protein product [Brachionus calyciflorus]
MRIKFKIFLNCVFIFAFSSYLFYVILRHQTTFNYFSIIDLFQNSSNQPELKNVSNLPRVFCILLTSEKNLNTKAKSIYEIWANQCDNFKFISLIPDELLTHNSSNNTSNSTYLQLDKNYVNSWLQPPGLKEDTYDKLTTKVYLAYKHIYQLYPDYDWYLKSDDDTFIFVDNLKKFLNDKKPLSPVTYGYDFKVIVDGGYHSGGGGYLLSNEAFRRIGSKLNEDFTFCPNSGTEDVDVAKCLRKLDVYLNKSIDEQGRERFHPLNIDGHYYGHFPDWMFSYAANPLKKGVECCSDSSISFHYMTIEEMTRAKNVLNNYKNDQALTFKKFLENYYNRSID